MRLADLNPVFYTGNPSDTFGAMVIDSPNGDGARLGIGFNYPESVSYALITESGYVRVATPHWTTPPPRPKPMSNYVATPNHHALPIDPDTVTVFPVVDATNHGHGSFTITNGEVTVQ